MSDHKTNEACATSSPLRPILPLNLLKRATEVKLLLQAYSGEIMPAEMQAAFTFMRDELIPSLQPNREGEICPACGKGWFAHVWLDGHTRGGRCDRCGVQLVNGKQHDANLFDAMRDELVRLRAITSAREPAEHSES